MALTNPDGLVVAQYRYGPYGEAETVNEVDVLAAQPFRYASGYTDEATGWNKFGVRYQNPTISRWTTQDPLRQLNQPVDANRYTYASNNPTNLVDLTGSHSQGSSFGDDVQTGAVLGAVGIGLAFGALCLAAAAVCGVAGLGAALTEGIAVGTVAGGIVGGVVNLFGPD